ATDPHSGQSATAYQEVGKGAQCQISKIWPVPDAIDLDFHDRTPDGFAHRLEAIAFGEIGHPETHGRRIGAGGRCRLRCVIHRRAPASRGVLLGEQASSANRQPILPEDFAPVLPGLRLSPSGARPVSPSWRHSSRLTDLTGTDEQAAPGEEP